MLLLVVSVPSCEFFRSSKAPAPALRQDAQLPHKVAILPFVNRTSNPEAAGIVRKMFYNFFSSLNYLDVEPSRVDEELKRKNLYKPIVTGRKISPQKLGRLLGVDAIILGEVLSFGKTYAVIYAETRAGLRARMVRCGTRERIWELEHTARLAKGDFPLSIPGLAKALVTSFLGLREAVGMKAASELCMQMVDTIPNPPAITDPPPRIEVLVHNGAGRLLRAGDALRVVMIGDPGHEGTWEILPLIKDLPLKEKKPGTYIGAYKVTSADRVAYGRLVGHLRSRKGMGSQWSDVLGAVSLGEPTILPSVVSEDIILTAENSPYLVEDALLVQPHAKLIVNPGTVVWFRRFGLIIRGAVEARGTPGSPIRFSGMGSSPWKGIFLDGGHGKSVFINCKIANAEYGLRTSDGKVVVSQCLFQDNVWAVVLDGGDAQIHDSLIRTSDKTGISARGATLLIKNSMISENQSGGILLKACRAQIERNNIANNGEWELKILGNEARVTAPKNWWGNKDLREVGIIGSAKVKPALKKPVDFAIFDEMTDWER